MILLLLALLPASLAYEEPDPDELLVLDVDWGNKVVAWKSLAVDGRDDGASGQHNCGYPGMTDRPFHGVTLGISELSEGGKSQSFEIYKSASDAEDCTDEATAKQRLAEAKALFASRGLDIAERPEMHRPKAVDEYKRESTMKVGGITVAVTDGASEHADVSAEVFRDDPEYGGVKLVQLLVQNQPAATHHLPFSYAVHGRWNGTLEGALANGSQLLVQYTVHIRGMRGSNHFPHWAIVDTAGSIEPVVHLPELDLPRARFQRVEVLDFDVGAGLAAVKVVATPAKKRKGDPCGYAGMEPDVGVMLGLWDLNRQSVIRAYEVYAFVRYRPCTTPDESTAALAEAKVRLNEASLDIASPLSGVSEVDGTWTVEGVSFHQRDGKLFRGEVEVFDAGLNPEQRVVRFKTAYLKDGRVVFAYVQHFVRGGEPGEDAVARFTPPIALR